MRGSDYEKIPKFRGQNQQNVPKRHDLGTIPGAHNDEFEDFRENRGIPQSSSFIGSFTNMFFGRKGGYS